MEFPYVNRYFVYEMTRIYKLILDLSHRNNLFH